MIRYYRFRKNKQWKYIEPLINEKLLSIPTCYFFIYFYIRYTATMLRVIITRQNSLATVAQRRLGELTLRTSDLSECEPGQRRASECLCKLHVDTRKECLTRTEASRSSASYAAVKRNDGHIARARHSRDGSGTYALVHAGTCVKLRRWPDLAEDEVGVPKRDEIRSHWSVVRRPRLHPGAILNNHICIVSDASDTRSIRWTSQWQWGCRLRADALGQARRGPLRIQATLCRWVNGLMVGKEIEGKGVWLLVLARRKLMIFVKYLPTIMILHPYLENPSCFWGW